jgi:hypothetical protein
MSDLAQLSLQRAGLPSFPGATVPDQLTNARDAALAVLQKYVPKLVFDPVAAKATLDQISVWEERNNTSLSQVLSNPNVEALPSQIQLVFGSDKAQQFIIAVFTEAAVGLGPWKSGAVAREAASGQIIQPRWAEEDAQTRLQVFGGIVKMDQDGYLAKLFVPPPGGGQAFALGIAPLVVWAVVVTVVALAGLFLLYLYSAKRLDQNNKLMRDICDNAQKSGDSTTVAQCVEATVGLQQQGMFQGFDDLIRGLGKAVMIATVAYVVIKWGVPMLVEQTGKKKSRRAYA